MAEVSYLQFHENDDEEDLHAFDSFLFDRQNQVNFVIDMFHQSVEQSQSQSFRHPHRRNEGFMFSDCWDDFFIPGTTIADPDPSSNPNPNPDLIPDLEWEEIDDHEALNMISESDPDEAHESEGQANGLEWEVLLNAHNLEPNPDISDYNYAEYEMLFGQFLDNESSYSGRPPASRTVVENLSSVLITYEDYENNKTVCAVCKDEIGVGSTAKRLPCDHVYHGDCILPWLVIRNTCPVCRHELLTDDVDYELWKAERAASVRD